MLIEGIIGMKKNSLIRLFQDSKNLWFHFICITVSLIISGIIQSLVARSFGKVVEYGLSAKNTAMFTALGTMIFLLVFDCIRNPIHDWLTATTIEGMLRNIRIRIHNAILYAKISDIERRMRAGDLLSRVSEDMDSLCEILETALVWHIPTIIVAIVASVNCFLISWQLALFYFLLLPVSLYMLGKTSASVEPQQIKSSKSNGNAMNLATDLLNDLMVIKSYSLENSMYKRFSKSIDEAVSVAQVSLKTYGKMNAIQYIVQIVQMMVLFIAGILFVTYKYISVGNMLAFIAISVSISSAFSIASSIIHMYQRTIAYTKRIYEIIDFPIEKSAQKNNKQSENKEVIKFESVSFSYSNTKVFNDVSFTVRKNQKIGLVGPSGSGKSTIFKLICRFYEAPSGSIKIWGKELEAIPISQLRNSIALVLQDANLFDMSIFENILLGRQNATEDEVLDALKKVKLYDFVQGLEKGVHTQVGECGALLSGGQRQRIAIARAIIKDAPLVLLDEATSALDNDSELEVQMALDELLVNRTAIIIAHRLNTLRNVDYIICLDKKIIEEGTLGELLAAKGYFYTMKKKQSLFDEDCYE